MALKTTSERIYPLGQPPATFTPDTPTVLREPDINWNQLSGLIESSVKKVCRNFGQGLLVLSAVSGAGRHLAATRLTASPRMIINTCFGLKVVMIVSAVGGAVLWFFNRSKVNVNQLLKERGLVKDQIGTACLSDLRSTYHNPFVLSDHELNQWIRYLAEKSPFKDFITTQSERIFDLPLETETKDLLKARYLAYVEDSSMSYKTLIGEKAFQYLLSYEERTSLQKLIPNREVIKLSKVDVASYRQFIDQQGVEVLHYLDPIHLQPLARAFHTDAYDSGVGILQLEHYRAIELRVFGKDVFTALFQNIADREAVQSYKVFVERNGANAVRFITNPDVKQNLLVSFSAYVVNKGLGLVKTKVSFENAMAWFGEAAAQTIYSQVLHNEMCALGRGDFQYTEFRARNGIGEIAFNAYGNFDMVCFLRECFLRLPYADLVNPEYTRDRDLLGILPADIRAALWGRWNGMTFSGVLETDREGFIASVGENRYFNSREWTSKAVHETLTLSMKDVIASYGVLFTTGVLTAADGSFSNRLASEVALLTDWTTLVDTYGVFVFEQGLLEPTQVEPLVLRFINAYAESFLNDSFDSAILKYATVIQRFCLNAALAQKIKEATAAVTAEKQRYNAWLTGHEAEFTRRIQARNAEADRDIATLKSDYSPHLKESAKNAAQTQLLEKQAVYEVLEQEIKESQQNVDKAAETINEKAAALEELRVKKQKLEGMNVFSAYSMAEGQAQQAKIARQHAENYVQSQYATLQADLTVFQKQEQEMQAKIQNIEKLQKEQAQLLEKVQDPKFAQSKTKLQERIKHPDKPVTGLEAAEKAKKEVAEAPKLLKAMEADEKRLAELIKLLNQEDYQFNPLIVRHTSIKSAIGERQNAIDQIRSAAEAQAQLPRLRAEESQASQTASRWKELDLELKSLPQQIAQTSQSIEQLQVLKHQKMGALQEKKSRLRTCHQEYTIADANKCMTELVYHQTVERLARKTLEIREACSQEIEGVLSEKALLLAPAQNTKTQALQNIVLTFRQHM